MPSIWDRLKKAFGTSEPKMQFDENFQILGDKAEDIKIYDELGSTTPDKLDNFITKFVPENQDELSEEAKKANAALGSDLYNRAFGIIQNFNYSEEKNEFQSKFQEAGKAINRKLGNGQWKASREGISSIVSYMQMASCEIARQIYDNKLTNNEKDQAEYLKKASFYVDTGSYEPEYYNDKDINKVRDFYDDNEIHTYIDNIRTLRDKGNLSNTLNNLDNANQLSKLGQNINNKLVEMQNNFRFNLENNPKGATKNGVLPMFSEQDLKNVNRLCEQYIQENGYKNTPENKAIRNVKKAVDRATLFRLNHSPAGLAADRENKENMMLENLTAIGDRLKIVSNGSKSKQFNELCDALKEMTGKSISKWSTYDRERLRDAARDYIDAKKDGFFSGGSTRRTDKGQIRFDIAEEILNLCEGDLMKPSESKAERQARQQKKVVVKEKVKDGFKGLVNEQRKSEGRYTSEDKQRDKEKLATYYKARRINNEIALNEQSERKAPVKGGIGK